MKCDVIQQIFIVGGSKGGCRLGPIPEYTRGDRPTVGLKQMGLPYTVGWIALFESKNNLILFLFFSFS